MKLNRLTLIAAVVLGSLVLSGPMAQAAEGGKKKNQAKSGAAENARPKAQDRLKQMADRLQLTAEQQEKLKPIFQDENKKRKELAGKTDLTPQQRRAEMQKLREELNAKIKDSKILTEDQLAKWKTMQEEVRKRGPRKKQN